jgi:hypothetical protein
MLFSTPGRLHLEERGGDKMDKKKKGQEIDNRG